MPEITPKIIVLSEQLRGQSFELTKDEYSIGRHEDCAICIPDPTVSNHHCSLVRNDDGSYSARDEGSTNGTRVNGVKIQEQALVNSDILQVGAIEMLYDSEKQSSTSTPSTQTGINLQNTAGTTAISQVPNFSPFGSRSGLAGGKNKLPTYIMAGIIGVLVLAVLVVLGMLLVKLLTV